MADKRFFNNTGPITLVDVIQLTEAKLLDSNINLDQFIEDVSPLETATSSDLSFFINNKYLESFKNSKAGFCFIYDKHKSHVPHGMVALVHQNPYKAYAIIANTLYALSKNTYENISSTAIIHESVKLGKNCKIGNFVTIEEGVIIGDNTNIDHNSVIKRNVEIGNNCVIHSNVTITHSIIGNNCIIHSGVRIGQDGFGFASDHTGHMKVPQLGRVIIGNYVDIGANTTIDRGSAQDTIIGDMSQIDNLVQLGHNVKIGKACVIVAQVGVAGSTKLGDFVVLGGQVGVAGHLNIGSQVQIAAQSGVAQDIEDKKIMGGSPAVPVRQWHKQNFILSKLVKKEKNND